LIDYTKCDAQLADKCGRGILRLDLLQKHGEWNFEWWNDNNYFIQSLLRDNSLRDSDNITNGEDVAELDD
jgi:hypothetical protein